MWRLCPHHPPGPNGRPGCHRPGRTGCAGVSGGALGAVLLSQVGPGRAVGRVPRLPVLCSEPRSPLDGRGCVRGAEVRHSRRSPGVGDSDFRAGGKLPDDVHGTELAGPELTPPAGNGPLFPWGTGRCHVLGEAPRG